ncbi:MAG: helix-turn-helix domain-containing protein [Chloroflexota bacterium]
MTEWTFITHHGLVLLYVSGHPQCTAREMALAINVTERTVHRILDNLEAQGYIKRQRTGKGSLFQTNPDLGLRHELTRDVVVGDLIKVLSGRRRCKPKMG